MLRKQVMYGKVMILTISDSEEGILNKLNQF